VGPPIQYQRELWSDNAPASLFGVSAIQAVASGQAAIGVAVSAIQLLSAIASVKSSPAGTAMMEEKAAETRSAFVFFSLSTVFYIFSAGAYVWLMRTPEYREIKDDHGKRRISLSISQSSAADGEGAGLVSGRFGDIAPSPVARTIEMIKRNLPFNFTVAWVFVVTLVRRKK
jgi:equilibrative nucleoside transporter 1/2/3